MARPPVHLADDVPKTLELHRALAPKMARSVTPIAASIDGKTYQLGTGTFFRAGEFSFFVTAAHVLKTAKTHDALLRLVDGESQSGPVKHRDVALPKWTAYIGENPADVAVLPLPADIVHALPNRTILQLDEVTVSPSFPGGCWVMGFPAENVEHVDSDRTMTYSPFLLAAPLVEGETNLENFDPDYHFVLNARRDELWWPSGEAAEMPDQLGASAVAPSGRWRGLTADGGPSTSESWECRLPTIASPR